MVLRFFAYSEKRDEYKNKVAPFIEKYIKDKKDSFTDKIKKEIETIDIFSKMNKKLQGDF